MVVSINPRPSKDEFVKLINSTVIELNKNAKKFPDKIEKLTGNKLEPYVKDVMTKFAVGTNFENSIELISGQKFPDIVANRFYGVEVKTTIKNHWKTTGNSVMESTRVEDVERIFMFFGKLCKPIEFRCRPYEECLSGVVVTHSPRYSIDMNLEKGKTIFDKIKIPYDILRQEDNPVKPIINYYKSNLKPGQDLWWVDNDNEQSSNLIIDIWTNIKTEQKIAIKNKAMIYFPEIFSNRSDKFGRFAVWLVTREAIVCPNIRDLFTAGGKEDYIISGKKLENIPQIFIKLFKNIEGVLEELINTPAKELNDFWNLKVSERNKIEIWIKLVTDNSITNRGIEHLNIKQILKELIPQ